MCIYSVSAANTGLFICTSDSRVLEQRPEINFKISAFYFCTNNNIRIKNFGASLLAFFFLSNSVCPDIKTRLNIKTQTRSTPEVCKQNTLTMASQMGQRVG